jgi:glyoxylase-like metal-dependent hydrolase (beta-lactamase superfamily II)
MNKALLIAGSAIVVTVGALYASVPALKNTAMTKVVGSIPGEFFHPFEISKSQFAQAAPGIWWFSTKYTRSLIADTGDGLVVFDCFNATHAKEMREAIERNLIGNVRSTRIRALVYSHHHFDHIRGGAPLSPEMVVADRDVAGHLTEGWGVDQILRPTKALNDPDALKIGTLNVQSIDLGRGHADRLWAFYFPDAKLLFAPDLAFVKTLPPFNLPDTNYVGLQRQMRESLALPWDKWVPSHFQVSIDGKPYATRADFVAYQGMMRDFQLWTREGFAKYGVPVEAKKAEQIYTFVRTRAQAKYGDWVGFDSMSLPLMLQYLSATYLGF